MSIIGSLFGTCPTAKDIVDEIENRRLDALKLMEHRKVLFDASKDGPNIVGMKYHPEKGYEPIYKKDKK